MIFHSIADSSYNTICYSVRKPVEDITTNDIRAYLYTYQQTHDVGNRTLDGRRIVIHTFLEWCRNERYISDNPANRISAIKYEVKPREPLTGVDMELLRDACRTYREKAIIETFYSTGCRVSELVNLNRTDIDFRTGEVMLFGKGNKHRVSYINARAEVALKKYLFTRMDGDPALSLRRVAERSEYGYQRQTAVAVLFLYSKKERKVRI